MTQRNNVRLATRLLAVVVSLATMPAASGMEVTGLGLRHVPLGEAHVERLPDGSLAVSEITDSGQDGVGIVVGESEGLRTTVRFPDDNFPVGASLTLHTFGRWDDLEIQHLTELRMDRDEDGVDLFLDASDVGSPSFTVDLFLEGRKIHSEYDIVGTVGRILAAQDANVAIPEIGQRRLFDPANGESELSAVTTLRAPEPFLFRCPNGGEMLVDGLQLATNAYDRLAFAQFYFTGVDRCLLTRQDVVLFGQSHVATGDAVLDATADRLRVSNIGDSGRDGVDIDFDAFLSRRRTASFDLAFATLNLPGVGGLLMALRGTAVGNPGDALIGRASLTANGDHLVLGASFSNAKSARVLVQVLNDGEAVAEAIVDPLKSGQGDGGGVGGGMTTVNPPPLARIFAGPEGLPGLTRIAVPMAGPERGTYVSFDRPFELMFELPSAGQSAVTGDEVRLFAVDAGEAVDIAEVSLRARDIDELVITSESRRDDDAEGPLWTPGDCNADEKIDVSDPVCLLGHLFLGEPTELPCGDGSATAPGNVELLDFNGDRRLDLSDGVAQLGYLFASGPEPVLGTEPVTIEGCE